MIIQDDFNLQSTSLSKHNALHINDHSSSRCYRLHIILPSTSWCYNLTACRYI